MKIIDHLLHSQRPTFSCEIIPPPRGRSAQEIIETVETLLPAGLSWIDVTSHSSMASYHERADGTVERRVQKKRPGTLGICGIIQNRFKIDTVAHILCKGYTKEETEDALIELHYLGIHNILALRGDGPNYNKEVSKNRSVNHFAADLVKQTVDLRQGIFNDEISNCDPLDFCVGVAGYPEKHFESANFKTDLLSLKQKIDAGAEYIVTQMFFDNQKYFDFVKSCRDFGIHVPIIPGLKLIKSQNQISTLPRTFHIDLPIPLVDEITAQPEHAPEIGKNWALQQCKELIERGAPGIHFYVMNDAAKIVDLFKAIERSSL